MITFCAQNFPRTLNLAVLSRLWLCAMLAGAGAAPALAGKPLPPSEVLHEFSKQDSFYSCNLVGAEPGRVLGSTSLRGSTSTGNLWEWSEGEGYRELFNFTADHGRPYVAPTRTDAGDWVVPLTVPYAGPNSPPTHLQFFRLQANGSGEVIGRSSDQVSSPGALVQGPDRRFYGSALEYLSANKTSERMIYAVSLEGRYEVIHRFAAPGPTGPAGCGLTLGPDGALYGVTSYGGQHDAGVLYRLDTTGLFSILYDFPAIYRGDVFRVGVALGPDATFYGIVGTSVFAIQTDGSNFRVLKDFGAANLQPTSVKVGSDGRLYGGIEAYIPDSAGMRFHVYSMSLKGAVRLLYRNTKRSSEGTVLPLGNAVYTRQIFGPHANNGGVLTRTTLP